MSSPQLPEEIAARLDRSMPWWKLLDEPELSGEQTITRQASSFAQKLSRFRVAVVPDPRIDAGGMTGDTPCIAFRTSLCTRHVSHDYAAAKAQLERDRAFLMVKGKPSMRELNWVRNKGLEYFKLDQESRERLLAWLELLLQEPLENAEEVVRAQDPGALPWRGDQYARYRAMCEADGPVDEVEEESLKLLSGSKSVVARRQFSIFDEQPAYAYDETTVRLPTKPKQHKPPTLALLLDTHRIAVISDQTAAVGALLGAVFQEGTDDFLAALVTPAVPMPTREAASREPASPEGTAATAVTLPAWCRALAIASGNAIWSAEKLYQLWREAGLLPQATLDDLNERALDACDELLLEGDDIFDVNLAALNGLLALSAAHGAST